MMVTLPQLGQVVRVRQRRYFVEQVEPRSGRDDATLVRLSCLDDDAQGQSLGVLWEKEVDAEAIVAESWGEIATRGFDPPRYFSAYLHTLRWNCVTATDANLFQSPFRAGIKIDAYQLEPLQKALRLPRVNMFIADDVGLGKTIEAGLIVRELLLRKKARDVVVACPPSMLLQWRDEMADRFGMAFQIVDPEFIARVRRERGYGVNPWTTHTRFLISHRLLIDEGHTAPLRDWLGRFRPGSLLILDEAHHAAPSTSSRYAIDSKITRAVRDLAGRFEHRLFLSATPHNGHSNSFSSLLEILDPQRFIRGVPIASKKLLDAVMVRRLKEDLRALSGGFPERVVRQVDLDGLPPDAPELRLSRLLDEYRTAREARLAGESPRTRAIAALLIAGLQQRLLSSVEAFSRTIRVHERTARRLWDAPATAVASAGSRRSRAAEPTLFAGGIDSDDDRATLPEDDRRAEEDAEIEVATLETGPAPATADPGLERRLLAEMVALAEEARGRADARIVHLVDWIRDHQCPDLSPLGTTARGAPARWNSTRVLIFTEYDDTKRYLQQQLAAAIAGTELADERIAVYHGPTPRAGREEIKRAFTGDPDRHPVRILIATDAAREGINLQTHCWNLFHFDVPWNPSRLEQRNGRIDRKLQPSPQVSCHYFVYPQRPEDRILAVLVRKTEVIRRELGSLAQVLEGRLTRMLREGVRHADVDGLARDLDAEQPDPDQRRVIDAELEALARDRQEDLKGQIHRLQTTLERSQNWLDIDVQGDHFRAAISEALGMLGADPLRALPPADPAGAEVATPRYRFPALDARAGGDASWADTMDALRGPRRPDQKPWEWRQDSPIRPVVFRDTGTMSDDLVHLHLEHRVVRRLLGQFTAQGFVQHDLARACVVRTTDPIPRVILLGRLCLYGPGAARLHEEIVPVTARWVEPTLRRDGLIPYEKDTEIKTRLLLEDALLMGGTVDPVVVGKLQAAAAADVAQLLPLLEARGQAVAEGAIRLLRERAGAEADAMSGILRDQKRRIAEQLRGSDPAQLLLGFSDDERHQLEADRRAWDDRLQHIDDEIATEPDRIRALYEVKARRVEPVGLIYLWPTTG